MKDAYTNSPKPASPESRTDPKSGMPLHKLPVVPDNRLMKVLDGGGASRFVAVTFRDTSLLVVEGGKGSLEAIGELVDLPKIELPERYDKSRMDLFFQADRAAAERYLARDLEIPIRYYRRLEALMHELGL